MFNYPMRYLITHHWFHRPITYPLTLTLLPSSFQPSYQRHAHATKKPFHPRLAPKLRPHPPPVPTPGPATGRTDRAHRRHSRRRHVGTAPSPPGADGGRWLAVEESGCQAIWKRTFQHHWQPAVQQGNGDCWVEELMFCFAIYFCLTLTNCVLNEWLLCVLHKGEVLISCLLQLPPFSGQFVKLVSHVKCSFRWTWFPCTRITVNWTFCSFLYMLIWK